MNSRGSSPAARALAGVLILLALSSTQGCWGKRELEDRSLVTLMGVDISETGHLLVTTVIEVPRALTGGGRAAGRGGNGTSTVLMLSGEGKNILEALRKIETMNARELTTVHMAAVILGGEFARRDVGPIIDLFSRSLQFRHNTLVIVSRDRAVDFLKGFQNLEESEPSLYILKVVFTSSAGLGACPLVTMHEFMVGYNAVGAAPWAPYVGLVSARPAEADRGKSPEAGREAGKRSEEGDGAEAGAPCPKRVIDVLGTALFRKAAGAQRMVGNLDTRESVAALLMQGSLRAAYLDIAYPGDQSETTLLIHHHTSFVEVGLDGGTVKALFVLRMTASIEETQVATEQPETDQRFRQGLVYTAQDEMRALLERTFRKLTGLGADAIGLGRRVQTRFGSYQEWEAFDWPARFKDVEAAFNVKMDVPTAGFTIQKPYPR